MTIHTLHPHLANGKRPTLSIPVLKSDNLAVTLADLDAHIALLRCVADSATADDENAAVDHGPLSETLYFLHGKMRQDIDRLFALL